MEMEINLKKKTEKRLLLFAILFTVIQFISILFYKLDGYFDLPWTGESVLMAVMTFVMYYSFKNHTKNVMKPMVGAALMLVLYYEMDWALYFISDFENIVLRYENILAFKAYIGCQIAIFILVALMNIMHYVINSTHQSSPKKVNLNTIFYYAYIIVILVEGILCILISETSNSMISNFTGVISDIFFVGMIIIIENTLDEFRINREEKIN